MLELNKTDSNSVHEKMLSRQQLAERWEVSVEFLKRKEKPGKPARLKPIKLGYRCVRYRLSDIEELEQEMSQG